MVTVLIHEGEARGRGHFSFDNPDVSMDFTERDMVYRK